MPGNALVLGGSVAFGEGVREEDRFSEKLEDYYRGLNVWNLAVIGYAPDQELLLAGRWLPPVPWNLFVLQLSSSDVTSVAAHSWRNLHSVTGIPASIEASPPAAGGFSAAWQLLVRLATRDGPGDADLADALRRTLFSVREIGKLAGLRHVPMIVLQADGWGDGPVARAYHDGVVALAKEENFSLLEAATPRWDAAAHLKVTNAISPEVFKILFPGKPFTIR